METFEVGLVEEGIGSGPGRGLLRTLKAYVEVTKPASVFLLAFTAVATMVVAAGGQTIPLGLFLRAVLAAMAGCAGANAVTCYIDRDIDGAMERTKRRPLPTRRINPPARALYWGLVLTFLSLALAWQINFLAFLCAALGFVDNVVVYSLLMKRRSPLNVIWGGFSGGLPALFGWAVVRNSIDLVPILIAALVVLWIPNHIWNLAIFYSDDYKKVKVPMLPTVFTLEKTLRCIAATVLLLYAFSILLYFVGGLGPIYLGTALLLGFLISVGNIYLVLRPSAHNAWVMFKLSGPYLFLLFLGMIVDVLSR
ncbi:MAG: heme o synthase [Anaerolineae bacterium]